MMRKRSVLLAICLSLACNASHSVDPGADGGTSDLDGAISTSDDGGNVIHLDGSDIIVLPDGATIIVLPDGGTIVVGPDSGITTLHDGGPGAAHVGTPCSTESDCPGLFCSPAGTGFGYCSWICDPGTMPCPGDAVCAVFSPGSVGYCMQRCDPAASSCAMGFLCQPGIAEAPVCYPGCGDDGDCPTGEHCGMGVSGIRQCFSPTGVVGMPCVETGDCPEGGYCLDEASWGAPHGICVTFCDLSTAEGCGEMQACVPWGSTAGLGSCVPSCDDTHACRTGYACVPTGGTPANACVARCMASSDCSPGYTCNFVTGRCTL